MKHVVFGTGTIGTTLADILAGRGHKVVAVNRSGAAVGPGVEVVAGDAADRGFAASVTEGAEVVYQVMNPPYTKWPELFPPLQAAVLEAAAATSAKLVSLENLYMYGSTGGKPLTEDLPYLASGSKGRTRAEMSRELMAAHESGRVRMTIGRASDFFGPRALLSAMGERVMYPALAGKKAQVMGDPDQVPTYSFVPDVAEGLAVLGERDEADGQVWHLPNAPAVTTREFVSKVFATADTEVGISAMPRLMVSLVGVFNPIVRELKETLYEFEEPFVVDSSKFAKAFGEQATPLDQAIPATVDWFRANPRS